MSVQEAVTEAIAEMILTAAESEEFKPHDFILAAQDAGSRWPVTHSGVARARLRDAGFMFEYDASRRIWTVTDDPTVGMDRDDQLLDWLGLRPTKRRLRSARGALFRDSLLPEDQRDTALKADRVANLENRVSQLAIMLGLSVTDELAQTQINEELREEIIAAVAAV